MCYVGLHRSCSVDSVFRAGELSVALAPSRATCHECSFAPMSRLRSAPDGLLFGWWVLVGGCLANFLLHLPP